MKRPMPLEERQCRLDALRTQYDALLTTSIADKTARLAALTAQIEDPSTAPGKLIDLNADRDKLVANWDKITKPEMKKLASRIRQGEEDLELAPAFDLASYDKVLVQLSGGKDSVACLLHILEVMGIDWAKKHVELWHQDIDGGRQFMDWPITTAYCRAVAQSFGLPLLVQYREGGFEQEMLRDGSQNTGVVFYDTLEGETVNVPTAAEKKLATMERNRDSKKTAKGRASWQAKIDAFLASDQKVGKKNRVVLQWPALGDLSQGRWCSAYLKIMVCDQVINNDSRFEGIKTLVVTGERWEESSNRSGYVEHARHGSNLDNARVVHQWRPVLDYTEMDVWETLQRNGVVAHPAYHLGFGRVSCMFCIFGNADQFKTASLLDPHRFNKMVEYEKQMDHTVKGDISLADLVRKGTAYVMQPSMAALAMNDYYDVRDITCMPSDWVLPAGAFKECGGPS